MKNRRIKKIPIAHLEKTNEYINLCQSGYERCEPGYTYGPAIRDFYLIHYIISGRGVLETEEGIYSCSAGQAFIIYPEEVTTYSADESEPWFYCFVGFMGALVPKLLEQTGFCDGNRVVNVPEPNRLYNIVSITTAALKRPERRMDIWGISRLLEIMDIFASSSVRVPRAAQGSREDYVKQAKDYIHFNYAAELSVGELAKRLSLDRSYFGRIFKESTGMTPMNYIGNYRIEKAMELLSRNKLAIARIAELTGFKTLSAFYRMFRLRTGMSPREYRERTAR